MQLDLFENQSVVSEKLITRIGRFRKLIDESEETLELIAVNKMYESVVVKRGDEFLTAISRRGVISCEYQANSRDGFGTNLLILGDRFVNYESITVYKGSVINGCNVRELDQYLSDGWKVLTRGGVYVE